MLSALGLDEVQESAYRTLVGLGAAEIPELALRLARPEGDTERALRCLERQGLAARSSGRAGRWVAVPPTAALGTLLTRRRHELERAEQTAAALAEEYRCGAAHRAARDVVEVVSGMTAIRHRSLQLRSGAADEVCALIAGTERMPLGRPMGHGVRQRVVVERELLSRPAGLSELTTALGRGTGAQIRVVDRVPTSLLIADGRLALVALQRPPAEAPTGWPVAEADPYDGDPAAARRSRQAGRPGQTGCGQQGGQSGGQPGARAHSAVETVGLVEPEALIVHPSGLLASLHALFDAAWRDAVPLRFDTTGGASQPPAPAPDGPDGTDLEILSLLLAGLTDASVAKQLDLGLRTVQRRVKGLMELAGVTTRLQLGWHAYERCWISRTVAPSSGRPVASSGGRSSAAPGGSRPNNQPVPPARPSSDQRSPAPRRATAREAANAAARALHRT
ncbi:helix-turn-helix domain-containing protein [Streptomyces zagrosensis]|uniref:Putative transcriptional regulator n=1 Tax=Streptomyces zagrosensis TaxID=1042984 RepID=A0A7W9Q9J0_9ACTN|nr:helix-turn-helix domain-containing protein [Streptomyces zagrosensis]MBB5936125.1 putative transcriptional regulator [Streptomyces zagrosensis]